MVMGVGPPVVETTFREVFEPNMVLAILEPLVIYSH